MQNPIPLQQLQRPTRENEWYLPLTGSLPQIPPLPLRYIALQIGNQRPSKHLTTMTGSPTSTPKMNLRILFLPYPHKHSRTRHKSTRWIVIIIVLTLFFSLSNKYKYIFHSYSSHLHLFHGPALASNFNSPIATTNVPRSGGLCRLVLYATEFQRSVHGDRKVGRTELSVIDKLAKIYIDIVY